MSELTYPENLRYTPEHEWIAIDGDQAKVGVTAYAQDALGDVVYVSLPAVGDTVAAGESCGEVESTKSVSDLYSPVSGEVVAVNEELDSTPETVNSDPYEAGWMFTVKVSDPAELDKLMDVEAYKAQLG
ncbi:glycine cleavage system protein GcvH [Arsenicicoccus dermatophilus]|uniref:glycine cleavage system protein GcvH n=1 Tax=Arsenicicoccus dermatophilus TaxID=1076331 RepID=UPI001F4C92EB|nr:glycine cleavage system protein GcvH [Arsenicicoccus dermatophilus]MCH8612427.1 glycine cleavage system protein GcvH [Arsenicicoccus dermatophilus]